MKKQPKKVGCFFMHTNGNVPPVKAGHPREHDA